MAGVVVFAWGVAGPSRGTSHPPRSCTLPWRPRSSSGLLRQRRYNDALMVVAVVAGFAWPCGRLVGAVLVMALGAMVKVTAVVALPFIALLWAAAGPPSWAAPAPRRLWSRLSAAGVVPMVAHPVVTGLVPGNPCRIHGRSGTGPLG